MNDPNIFQVPQAKGLHSYPALGSVDAPFTLRNAQLVPGGWACANKAGLYRPDALTAVLWAGAGREFYAERPDGVIIHSLEGPLPLPSPHAPLRTAVRLGPRFLQLGQQYLSGTTVLNHTPSVTAWNGTGTPPAGPYYRLLNSNPTTYRIVPIQGALRIGPGHQYTVPLTLNLPGAATFYNFPYHVQVYERTNTTPVTWTYKVTNGVTYDGMTYQLQTGALTAPVGTLNAAQENEHMLVDMQLAEYHQGRVYFTAASVQVGMSTGEMQSTELVDNRLYFSEVINTFGPGSVPQLGSDYFFDIPFRVSESITAIKSVGRYLYIFGQNELFVLSGNDDNSWQLESLGDAIGTRASGSVQSIRNTLLYLGDGEVFLVRNGEVRGVGMPVRDLILNLASDGAQITSTVDFERNLYYLTDGTTILVYHLEGDGWATREVEGTGQVMVYMGGAPFTLFSDHLYTLDYNNAAGLLPMTLSLGPFGQPGWRRTWRGVTAAIDANGNASTSVQATGQDTNMDGQPTRVDHAPQTRPAFPGLTPLVVGLETNTAAVITMNITVTPAPGVSRCILRPPFTVNGQGAKEAWA